MHVPATSHSFTWWSDNNGSLFVYLILWVLEFNLRSSGWAASAFTLRAILPSHSWASNMTLPMKIVITTAVLLHYWKKKRYYFSEKDIKQLIQFRIQVEPLLFSSIRLWLFRVQGESGVGFVPLPQEGLPGFRGVKSAGECWLTESLCPYGNNPDVTLRQTDCQRLIQATFHSSSSSLQALANLKKKLTGHTEGKKDFPQSLGLVLCSAGDLFPLTIPRWRWGMRILQGNSSPPLGNRPSPDFSETLSRTQQGRQRLKDS